MSNEWKQTQLGDICDINPDTLAESSDASARFRYIDLSSVNEQKIDLAIESQLFSALPSRARRKVRYGDVLLGTVRPNLKNFAFISSSDKDLVASTGFAVLRSKEKLSNAEFIFHLINSDIVGRQLNALVTGSNYPAVNAGQVGELLVPIPPLPEQKKIAEILSGIDRLLLAMHNRIDKVRTAQEGLANSWEEKVIPEKEKGALGDLIASIDSGWSPACEEVPPESGEWGVLKVSAVTKGCFCEDESKRLPSDLQPRLQCLIKKDDLLITRANGNLDLVGRGAIVEHEPSANLLMSDKILRLNPKEHADRNFLLLLLNSRNVRRQIETAVGGSTGAKNIGQSLLRQISIAIPASKDQAKIGNLSQSLSATISAAQKRLDYLVSLKEGLLADLLTGRKRVSI